MSGKRHCRTLSTGGKLKNRMLRDACLTAGILVFGPRVRPAFPHQNSNFICNEPVKPRRTPT